MERQAVEVVPDEAMVADWGQGLEELIRRMAPHFVRIDALNRAWSFLLGLLSAVTRKNGWQLSEEAGETTPYGFQHLLGQAKWDEDGVRDVVREYAVEALAADWTVGVIDESGFPKKGTHSVGVQRQYCGRLGKIENCQVGVFLGYATAKGAALIARALYLPEDWAADADRRAKAGVPQAVTFQTKPQLAVAYSPPNWSPILLETDH